MMTQMMMTNDDSCHLSVTHKSATHPMQVKFNRHNRAWITTSGSVLINGAVRWWPRSHVVDYHSSRNSCSIALRRSSATKAYAMVEISLSHRRQATAMRSGTYRSVH